MNFTMSSKSTKKNGILSTVPSEKASMIEIPTERSCNVHEVVGSVTTEPILDGNSSSSAHYSNISSGRVSHLSSHRKSPKTNRSSRNSIMSSKSMKHRLRIKKIIATRKNICSKIVNDINRNIYHTQQQLSYKYDPIPFITMSKKLVEMRIGTGNIIILKNPAFDTSSSNSNNIHYDSCPEYVGDNIDLDNINNIDIGVILKKMKRKHIAILTSKQHLFSLIESTGKKIIEIEIPDDHLKSVHNYSSKISTLQHDIYVLLMFSSNHCDTSIEEQSKWTLEFAECIKKNMKINMRGTIKKNKHHGCLGNYYGFGVTSKYSIDSNNLSIGKFSGNENDTNPVLKTLLDILKSDICFIIKRMQSALPDAIYCGYSLMASMIMFLKQNKAQCNGLWSIIDHKGSIDDDINLSSLVCENAETLQLHQEIDSSYTLISVPTWNKDTFIKHNKIKGKANFIFSWTSESSNDRDKRNCTIQMSDGTSILFSGYGLYHRQHRTNDGIFWNYGTYQNKKLYNSLRKSMIRNIKDNQVN